MVMYIDAMTLGISSGGGKSTAIGIGMWLGLIMAFNVWFVIWPNQKRALGIVELIQIQKLNLQKQQCCFLEQIHCFLCQCYCQWLQLKTYIKIFLHLFSITV